MRLGQWAQPIMIIGPSDLLLVVFHLFGQGYILCTDGVASRLGKWAQPIMIISPSDLLLVVFHLFGVPSSSFMGGIAKNVNN